jgi:hypothetical protein
LRGPLPGEVPVDIDKVKSVLYASFMSKQKEGWEQFFKEGQEYHRTVLGSLKRPEIFTPEIIQNIAAMGIEKYFMAIFISRGMLPRNHTMSDFVEETKSLMPLPEELEESLLYFDSLQNICSFDDFRITKPGPEDVDRFINAINQVAALAEQETGFHAAHNNF